MDGLRPGQFSSVRIGYTFHLGEAEMAKLTRWGNSVGGLRLPKAVVEAAGLQVGDEVSCRLLDSGAILLTPCRRAVQAPINAEATVPQRRTSRW